MMSRRDDRPVLRLGHSPDPDDAFMWWPLLELDGRPPRLDTGRFRFDAVAEDIETLNRRSEQGDLDITAMSCAQYPHVKDAYALTACGASLGEAVGPKLVAKRPMTIEELTSPHAIIAVPGTRTSAFAVAGLLLGAGRFGYEVLPFDQIIQHVASGAFDAGLVIHEGQLTYEQAGLHLIVDLGAWWSRQHGLPLPLGVNAIRRDLPRRHGAGTLQEVTGLLRQSVEFALAHREESLAYALGFGRGIAADVADEFISMYVNRWTIDFGPTGQRAVRTLLQSLHAAGLAPEPGAVDFVAAGPARDGRGAGSASR
jgi:1,4-dihydroxy-6-naphthoate synthase